MCPQISIQHGQHAPATKNSRRGAGPREHPPQHDRQQPQTQPGPHRQGQVEQAQHNGLAGVLRLRPDTMRTGRGTRAGSWRHDLLLLPPVRELSR